MMEDQFHRRVWVLADANPGDEWVNYRWRRPASKDRKAGWEYLGWNRKEERFADSKGAVSVAFIKWVLRREGMNE